MIQRITLALAERAARKRITNLVVGLLRLADDWQFTSRNEAVARDAQKLTSETLGVTLGWRRFCLTHVRITGMVLIMDGERQEVPDACVGTIYQTVLKVKRQIARRKRLQHLDTAEVSIASWITSNPQKLRKAEVGKREQIAPPAVTEARQKAKALVSIPARYPILRSQIIGGYWMGQKIIEFDVAGFRYRLEDGSFVNADEVDMEWSRYPRVA